MSTQGGTGDILVSVQERDTAAERRMWTVTIPNLPTFTITYKGIILQIQLQANLQFFKVKSIAKNFIIAK